MSDLDTFARTLFGEARGESLPDMEDVASVIMHRFQNPRWWSRDRHDGIPDDTIAAVCRDPWQFSCWNVSDPNRGKLLTVTDRDPSFRRCLEVARRAMAGEIQDRTCQADHYLTHHALRTAPPYHWARTTAPVYRNHAHTFFRLELKEVA